MEEGCRQQESHNTLMAAILERRAVKLLGPDDPSPVTVLNEGSDYPVVLVCEHAGRAIPVSLGFLGLERRHMDLHIAWDIGTEALCRQLSQSLGATAVLQPYSRLVIDCNRPTNAPDAMPAVSDHVAVPANVDLIGPARQARIDEIFTPFHRAVDDILSRASCKAAFSVHSFTPIMNGVPRPWDIGFLYRKDEETSKRLGAVVARQSPDLVIGFNQPYQIDDLSDWFVPQHGERRAMPHSLIEIRNDHLGDDQVAAPWAVLLATAIDAFARTI